MKVGTGTQQPGERFSYTINYARALPAGDGIKNATLLAVSPTGLTVNNVGVFDTRVRFWVTGGVAGRTYKVTLKVETDDGRIFEDEVHITVKEV